MPENTDLKCDFCCVNAPTWRYRARDFDIRWARYKSVEDWAACDSCRLLIDNNKWDKLADIAMLSYKRQFPQDWAHAWATGNLPYVREAIKELHRGFNTMRLTTKPEPITPCAS